MKNCGTHCCIELLYLCLCLIGLAYRLKKLLRRAKRRKREILGIFGLLSSVKNIETIEGFQTIVLEKSTVVVYICFSVLFWLEG